eukprot:SM000036S13254  [mRNA]  locus=s36:140081:146191:- [translate_table: standard]
MSVPAMAAAYRSEAEQQERRQRQQDGGLRTEDGTPHRPSAAAAREQVLGSSPVVTGLPSVYVDVSSRIPFFADAAALVLCAAEQPRGAQRPAAAREADDLRRRSGGGDIAWDDEDRMSSVPLLTRADSEDSPELRALLNRSATVREGQDPPPPPPPLPPEEGSGGAGASIHDHFVSQLEDAGDGDGESGTRKAAAAMEEERRHSKAESASEGSAAMSLPFGVLDPEGPAYLRFYYLTIILAIKVAIVEPFNVAFLNSHNIISITNALIYVTDAVRAERLPQTSLPEKDCKTTTVQGGLSTAPSAMAAVAQVFLADVAVKFRLAVFADGQWKVSRRQIAEKYLRGSFAFDLLAALPWDVALKLALAGTELAADVSLVGLTRLLRLKRLWQFFWQVGVDMRFSYFGTSVVKFSALIFFAAHWAACGFYLLARLHDFDSTTWVAHDEPGLQFTGPFTAYVTSIYWAMTTLSTTGYGDFAAFTNSERLWTAGFMAINLGLTAYVLGNMTVLLTKADAQTAQYRDKLATINRYMKAHNVPSVLQQEMRAHLRLHFETSELRDDILRQCPVTIRGRIVRQVYAKHIARPYLFKGTSDLFKDQLVTHMRVDFFLPNTNVVTVNDSTSELFIIASGQAEAVYSKGDRHAWFEYGEGDPFGEFAFICGSTQSWTVRTRTVCRVLVLERDGYETLCKNHPQDNRQVVVNVLDRIRAISDAAAQRNLRRSLVDLTLLIRQDVEAYIGRLEQETVASLCYAAKRGDMLELYRLLSSGFDINMADYDGRTPLHLAAAYGQGKAVDYLLNSGATANVQDAFYRTPLREAVSAGHVATAKILYQRGGQLQLSNEGTHLCRLAFRGDVGELRRLLEFGANPDSCDYDCRAPMHIAAAEGQLGIVLLGEGKANVNVLDRWHQTPLDEARRCGNRDMEEHLARHGGQAGSGIRQQEGSAAGS